MKRKVGLLCLVLGLVGFFAGNMTNSGKQTVEQQWTQTGTHTHTFEVTGGTPYEARLWVIDEETGLQQWGEAAASMKLTDAPGSVLFDKGVRANASSSERDGGVSRAQNGVSHRWTPAQSGQITAEVRMDKGDKVELTVYRDLSETGSMLPGLSIVLAVIGLVLLLQARQAAMKS